MQPKTVTYPIFLFIEVLRLLLIVSMAAVAESNALLWCAALPVLCVAPALWLMLSLDESKFTLWLPLLAFIKALSAVSFIALSIRLLPDALRFGTAGGNNPAAALPLAGLFVLVDGVMGIFSYGRYRVLCK